MNRSWRYVFTAFCLTSSGSLLWSQPQDAVVAAGKATLTQVNPSTLQIQVQDKTIVNWRDFSIKEKECIRFVQPGKHAAVLNRVTGSNKSYLNGRLEANGNVYLINTHGIIVGPKGVINVGGFVGSSLDVLDKDFLQKRELPFSGNSPATIRNMGRIEASSGDVVLMGHFVDNQGTITAPQGTVAMAAESNVLLKLDGEETIAVHLKKEGGVQKGTGVENSGHIEAVRAELKADGNVYAMAINHTGSVQALGVVEKGGRVLLVAEGGTTSHTGQITAKNADGSGGQVHLLGRQVNVSETGFVDVSGEGGGGTLLIGGDFQGKNPEVLNAQSTYVGKDALLSASALKSGDAGKVIVWADGNTHFYGKIEAIGGEATGDGGLAEVSGKRLLDFKGRADLTAPQGKVGTLLLDPTDLTISTAGTLNVSAAPLFEPDAQVPVSNLNNIDLQNALMTSNVTVQTLPDTVTPASGGGDIIWEDGANVTNPSSTTSLTINAYRDFNMGATYDNFTNSGTGEFVANAGRDINFLSLASPPSTSSWINNTRQYNASGRPGCEPDRQSGVCRCVWSGCSHSGRREHLHSVGRGWQ